MAKTIEDINPDLKDVFKHFQALGWKQPKDGFPDRFVLEHPTTGHYLEVLNFPSDYVAVINKSGTTILGAGVTVDEINKNYKCA
jgi:hypothetical protein